MLSAITPPKVSGCAITYLAAQGMALGLALILELPAPLPKTIALRSAKRSHRSWIDVFRDYRVAMRTRFFHNDHSIDCMTNIIIHPRD